MHCCSWEAQLCCALHSGRAVMCCAAMCCVILGSSTTAAVDAFALGGRLLRTQNVCTLGWVAYRRARWGRHLRMHMPFHHTFLASHVTKAHMRRIPAALAPFSLSRPPTTCLCHISLMLGFKSIYVDTYRPGWVNKGTGACVPWRYGIGVGSKARVDVCPEVMTLLVAGLYRLACGAGDLLLKPVARGWLAGCIAARFVWRQP